MNALHSAPLIVNFVVVVEWFLAACFFFVCSFGIQTYLYIYTYIYRCYIDIYVTGLLSFASCVCIFRSFSRQFRNVCCVHHALCISWLCARFYILPFFYRFVFNVLRVQFLLYKLTFLFSRAYRHYILRRYKYQCFCFHNLCVDYYCTPKLLLNLCFNHNTVKDIYESLLIAVTLVTH